MHDALADARTVINVGAGAGSYEPEDRYVVAGADPLVVADRVEYPSNFTCTEQPGSLGCGDSVEESVAHDHVAAVDECTRDCR